MGIGGNVVFDFQGAELMRFAQSNAAIGEQLDVQKSLHEGFHKPGIGAFEVGSLPQQDGVLVVPWTLIQYWAIDELGSSRPQRIQTICVETIAWREIESKLYVELAVKDGVSSETEKGLCDAFNGYRYPDSGDLDSYIEKCLETLPGVSPYAFELLYFYRVQLLSNRKVDDTKLAHARHVGDGKFSLKLLSEQDLTSLRQNPPHPNLREALDAETAVKEVAEANLPGYGCDGMITDFKEVARAATNFASRVSWLTHRVKIKCAIFDVPYPKWETRDQDLVAYVYWTHPGSLDQYVRKMVENCAKDSAVSAVVALIIFADLATACASFKSLFWKCLREKLQQTASCLDVGILVNTETKGDWH